MGKRNEKKKKLMGEKSNDPNVKQSKVSKNSTKTYNDADVFISLSRELKEEGNNLYQKRDYEGALLKYEKSINLLPKNHVEVSYIRCKMADCYMNMGLSEYPKAINECNLALEISPKYSKALLKRAVCYEASTRLDLSFKDVGTVLKMEPNNLMAKAIAERVKTTMEEKGIKVNDVMIDLPLPNTKPQKKKNKKIEEKKVQEKTEEKKAEVQVAEKKISCIEEEEPRRTLKLVLGEDIRWAKVPINCSILTLREIISDRYPNVKAIRIKCRDQEGDLVTISSNEELRWAEETIKQNGSLRLYISEVNPDQDPFFEKFKVDVKHKNFTKNNRIVRKGDWFIQFAQQLKNHVGFSSDACLDLHELGMKLYSEAIDEKVKIQESQKLFDSAEDKFQEMTILALFNLGNVHMTRARKRVSFKGDTSKESVRVEVESAYKWAQKEYLTAQKRYEEALKIKPDFIEGVVALGQQQFEQAKLSWYYAIGSNVDLETWSSSEVIQLYNSAEEIMDRGIVMCEKAESRPNTLLQKMDFNGLIQDVAADQGDMRSQIYLLWGTMLYERSIMEYKLELPVWQECLEVAVEKFELAGASQTDIAVMIKNHCSNNTALEGFDIDEMVQAWSEMDDAKRWHNDVPSPRSTPVLRRRGSKLHHALEYA
ncbi:hypothetical protein LguiB_010466 [Lonicera macranthoides]